MCGALAMSCPSASNTAQEKSSRSLMFDRVGGFFQRHAHLLGDRHEEVVEYLQHDRIGLRCRWRLSLVAAALRVQDQMQRCGESRRPQPSSTTIVPWASMMSGRSVQRAGPGLRLVAVDRPAPRASRRRQRSASAPSGSGSASREPGRARSCACTAAHGLHRHRLDDDRLFRRHEAELRPMRLLEGRPHLRRRRANRRSAPCRCPCSAGAGGQRIRGWPWPRCPAAAVPPRFVGKPLR